VCTPFQSISVEEKVCQMMMNCLEQTSFPFEEREETLLYGCTINVLCDRGGIKLFVWVRSIMNLIIKNTNYLMLVVSTPSSRKVPMYWRLEVESFESPFSFFSLLLNHLLPLARV
jgi:hypothetical protein